MHFVTKDFSSASTRTRILCQVIHFVKMVFLNTYLAHRARLYSRIRYNTPPIDFRRRVTSRKFLASSSREAVTHSDEVWQRLLLAERQLALAVSDENYRLAAIHKKELEGLKARLPPEQSQLFSQLSVLKLNSSTMQEKLDAIEITGNIGDISALPSLFALLSGPSMQARAAKTAMSRIRSRINNATPEIACLFHRASSALAAISIGAGEGIEIGVQEERGSMSLASSAQSLFTQVLNAQPTHSGALIGRGLLSYRLFRFKDAIRDLESALEIDPWHMVGRISLALSHGHLKQFNEAYATLESVTAMVPAVAHSPEYKEAVGILQGWQAYTSAFRAAFREKRASVLERRRLCEERQKLEEDLNSSQ